MTGTTAQDHTGRIVAGGRILLTLALIPLGRSWFTTWGEDAGFWLLRGINLSIHEFGHFLFQPFGFAFAGETGVILGGSLTQVVFPLIFTGYFLFSKKHRDVHAAMICFWWAAMNLAEVAIYAHDARARELMLITGGTGQETDGHDFYNLFSRWGVLNRDIVYAGRMRALAAFMFFVSILVGIFAAVMPLMGVKNREAATDSA